MLFERRLLRMKKTLLALALGLAMVFAFTACGDSDSESSGDSGSKELNIFTFQEFIKDFIQKKLILMEELIMLFQIILN